MLLKFNSYLIELIFAVYIMAIIHILIKSVILVKHNYDFKKQLGSLVYEFVSLIFIFDNSFYRFSRYISNRDLMLRIRSDIPLLVLVPLWSIYILMFECWLVDLFGWNHGSMVQSLYPFACFSFNSDFNLKDRVLVLNIVCLCFHQHVCPRQVVASWGGMTSSCKGKT